TRPEGLGGLYNAGPAIASPRPPYVTKAPAIAVVAAADPEGLFNYRLLRGGEDKGPALATFFFFLPTAGELTANSTLFFFDFCSRYGYGYSYSKRPRTRPEGLGGLRDAGPATAGPRPPYVTEAVRYSGYTLQQ
ncbi:hypothetical protein L249_5994, partial [Ophiocordyceps polyrhachis-furcata BCC 54312]